jgi:hypoxanthine phosphoribosyltransferase
MFAQDARSLKCFVIMPSGNKKEYAGDSEESDFVFRHIITPAVREACGPNVDIIREADKSTPGAIDRSIVENIAVSDIAIVDITGHNANVFFELGMRYALRPSTTILLRQKNTSIPFDIAGYRCVYYDSLYEGPDRGRRAIAEAIRVAMSSNATDSLVYNVYPRLKLSLNSDDNVAERDKMPWEEFWIRLKEIDSHLRREVADGRYHPHVIVGLSNGGMLFADLLVRNSFTKTPTASLWVNRWDRSGNLFDNPLNRAVVESFIEFVPNKKISDAEILVVDDIVASGQTNKAAFRFLRELMPEASIWFLPLFSRNQNYYELISEHLIWNHSAFSKAFANESQVHSLHTTQRKLLPYDKEIRST